MISPGLIPLHVQTAARSNDPGVAAALQSSQMAPQLGDGTPPVEGD